MRALGTSDANAPGYRHTGSSSRQGVRSMTRPASVKRDMRALEQAKEASDLAEKAFAAGDIVTGIAAISLAAQLVQLAKLHSVMSAKGA